MLGGCSLTSKTKGPKQQASSPHFEAISISPAEQNHMDGCQNYGPILDPINTRCRILLSNQKGTKILTTTHMIPQRGSRCNLGILPPKARSCGSHRARKTPPEFRGQRHLGLRPQQQHQKPTPEWVPGPRSDP